MKTFSQFIIEADSASGQTSSAISRSGSGSGSSGNTPGVGKTGFQKRDWNPLRWKRIRSKKNQEDKKKTTAKDQPQTPETNPETSTTQNQRQPLPYRYKKVEKPEREKGGPLANRPPSSNNSMVARRTTASQQPPQHRQISARPVSTAMAGSRQRPAIRPGNERPMLGGSPQRKSLPPSNNQSQKRLEPAQQRKQLPPARG